MGGSGNDGWGGEGQGSEAETSRGQDHRQDNGQGHGQDTAGLELRALALAGLAWLGADIGPEVLHAAGVMMGSLVLIGLGLWFRLFPPLAVGVFCLLSFLGASADAAYQPMAAGSLTDEVTVVGDPKPVGLGWRVDLRLADGRRVEAVGYGPVGWDMSAVSVGEVQRLVGRVRPPGERSWYRVRHISGLVSVEQLEPVRGPGLLWRIPESARAMVVGGADTMSERHRALYLGLVIGDDRFQPLGQQLNFRSAGLTHLLAVSGQNVAFVLAVARGPLSLFGRKWRLLLTVAVLVVFAVVTRMEPSVMRATAAALLAVWAAASGRERSGVIILSLAVVGVLCVDPFLADSVGFQLSVAASLGILVLSPAIERRLPGPGWLAAPMATTLAAQIGVSPVLSAYFGPVSVVSIPANLLAGWAAALVMTLGLTAGVIAGLLPDPAAAILQLPTVTLLRWLDWVAAIGGRTAAPRFGPVGLSGLAMAVLVMGRRTTNQAQTTNRDRPLPLRAFALAAVTVLFVMAWPTRPDRPVSCGTGVTWYPAVGSAENNRSLSDQPVAASVLVIAGDAYAGAIEGCLDRGIRSADVVVARRGGRSTARLMAAVQETMQVGRILAPPQHRIVGATRLLQAEVLITGTTRLVITPADRDQLVVSTEPAR